MKLAKWDPFRDVEDMFDRYTRAMSLPMRFRYGQERMLTDAGDWSPRVDISETDNHECSFLQFVDGLYGGRAVGESFEVNPQVAGPPGVDAFEHAGDDFQLLSLGGDEIPHHGVIVEWRIENRPLDTQNPAERLNDGKHADKLWPVVGEEAEPGLTR